jgi:hypothetical protein
MESNGFKWIDDHQGGTAAHITKINIKIFAILSLTFELEVIKPSLQDYLI